MAEVKPETTSSAHTEAFTLPSDSLRMVDGSMLWRTIGLSLRQADMIKNAIDELGLKFSETMDGKTRFFQCFHMYSWQKLKDACDKDDKGKLLDFFRCVFVSTGAEKKLGIGSFRWKLSMYKITDGKYHRQAQETGKLVKVTTRKLNKLHKLFKEELDPNVLFETLKSMDAFGEKDELPDDARHVRMEFLLERLLHLKGPDTWFRILQNYSKEYGFTYVQSEISAILGKRADDESQPGKEIFTANFKLLIRRKSVRSSNRKGCSSPMNENHVPDFDVNISMQDSKWHPHPFVDADGKESSAHGKMDSEPDIAMSLEPDLDISKETTARRGKSSQKRQGTTHKDVSGKKHCGSPTQSNYYLRDSRTQQNSKGIEDGTIHRSVLNICLPALVRDLDFETVSIYIKQKELFDDVTFNDIIEQRTKRSEKIKDLIQGIQQRDPETYKKFKECLVLAKQEFLKDMLEKKEAELKETEDAR